MLLSLHTRVGHALHLRNTGKQVVRCHNYQREIIVASALQPPDHAVSETTPQV